MDHSVQRSCPPEIIILSAGANLTMGGNTLIANNSAGDSGGGIAFIPTCTQSPEPSVCAAFVKASIGTGCNISSNTAGLSGGGIYLPLEAANINMGGVRAVASNNKAMFGADVAVPPRQLVLDDNSGRRTRLLQADGNRSMVTMVSRSEPNAGFVPRVGIKAISSDGTPISGVRLEVRLRNRPDYATPQLSGILSSTNRQNGTASFDNLKLWTQAGTGYVLGFHALDYPSVQPLLMNVSVRPCELGEVTTKDMHACDVCPPDAYSLQPLHTSECSSCPQNAVCYGGSSIVPDPRFWRSSTMSDNIVPCPNPSACQGNRSLVWTCHDAIDGRRTCSSVGSSDLLCTKGYAGTLCGECADGFGAVAPLICRQCASPAVNITLVVLCALALVFWMWITVHTTKTQNNDVKSHAVSADFLKILTRHVQYLLIIFTVPLAWPHSLSWMLSSLTTLYNGGVSTSSLGCFLLDAAQQEGDSGSVSAATLVRIFSAFIVPIVIFILLIAFQVLTFIIMRVFSKQQGNKTFASGTKYGLTEHLRAIAPVSTLVVIFFAYPSMVRTSISMFSCIGVSDPVPDGQISLPTARPGSYWLVDVTVRCWTGSHTGWALGIGICGTLILCGLLPLSIALSTWRWQTKSSLASPDVRMHYGFLYANYKDKYAWWEAVSSLQLVFLILVSTLGYSMGPYNETLVITAVLFLMTWTELLFRPMRFRQLHGVQLFSHICLCAMAFLGMASFSVHGQDDMALNVMGLLVIIVNCGFVLLLIAAALKSWRKDGTLAKIVRRVKRFFGCRVQSPGGAYGKNGSLECEAGGSLSPDDVASGKADKFEGILPRKS
jgi:hypothetical protein